MINLTGFEIQDYFDRYFFDEIEIKNILSVTFFDKIDWLRNSTNFWPLLFEKIDLFRNSKKIWPLLFFDEIDWFRNSKNSDGYFLTKLTNLEIQKNFDRIIWKKLTDSKIQKYSDLYFFDKIDRFIN